MMQMRKIKHDDILIIAVSSSKPELAIPYNLFSVNSQLAPSAQLSSSSSNSFGGYGRLETEGYLVDAAGNIDFPILGKIEVAGLTRIELSEKLKEILEGYMPDPVVTVSLVNYKITILGEVARPGTYNIVLDKVSLFDALGIAGDMTVYGKRDNILIIRETNGIRETARLNIKSKAILDSPYFYLQPNDVIVIDPVGAKVRTISPFVQNLPLFVSMGSLATSIATIVFYFLR